MGSSRSSFTRRSGTRRSGLLMRTSAVQTSPQSPVPRWVAVSTAALPKTVTLAAGMLRARRRFPRSSPSRKLTLLASSLDWRCGASLTCMSEKRRPTRGARGAAIIAQAARTPPDALRSIQLADESVVEFSMLRDCDDDILAEMTIASNRIRGLLTQIHPTLEQGSARTWINRRCSTCSSLTRHLQDEDRREHQNGNPAAGAGAANGTPLVRGDHGAPPTAHGDSCRGPEAGS